MADRNFITGYDVPLTNMVLSNPDNEKYVWSKFAPQVHVGGSSGVVPVDLSFAQNVDISLRPGADTKIVSHTGTKVTITTTEKGSKEFAKKSEANLVGGFSQLTEIKSLYVSKVYNVYMENLLRTKLTGATNKTALSGTDQWSDDSSDPYAQVLDLIASINAKGYMPNSLVLGADVYNRLRAHPNILKYVKYRTAGNVLSINDIKALFGVDNVFVSYAVQETATKGASSSKSLVLNKLFAIGEVAKAPNWGSVSAMYTPEFITFSIKTLPHQERPDSGSWVVGYADNDIIEYVSDALWVLTSVLA